MGWGSELCASKLRCFQKFRKTGNWTKNCHSEAVKNQHCSSLFQRKSALFSPESALFQRKSALKQRWILALKIFVFSAIQSWISAVQRFSGNEQRWNRPEIVLSQSWSALNVSETSTRVNCYMLWKTMYEQLRTLGYFRLSKLTVSFKLKILLSTEQKKVRKRQWKWLYRKESQTENVCRQNKCGENSTK